MRPARVAFAARNRGAAIPVVVDPPPVDPPVDPGGGGGTPDPVVPGATTWKPVDIGAGGLVTGITFLGDGTPLIRDDTEGAYRWDTTLDKWVHITSSYTLPAEVVHQGLGSGVASLGASPTTQRAFMGYDDKVFRTEDGGLTFTLVDSPVYTESNDDFRTWGQRLTVDPTNPDVVWYGTQAQGLRYSFNGGTTWATVPAAQIPFGLQLDLADPTAATWDVNRRTNTWEGAAATVNWAGAGVNAVAIDPKSQLISGRRSVIYVTSYGNGVYRSTDAGVTWAKISNDSQFLAASTMRVLDNGDLMLCGLIDPKMNKNPSKVWRYRGTTWTDITPVVNSGLRTWRSVAEDPMTPGRVAVNNVGGGVSISYDYGTTWYTFARTLTSVGDIPWLADVLNYGSGFMTPGELRFDPKVKGKLWFTEGIAVWVMDVEAWDRNSNAGTWQSQARGIEQLVPNDVIAAPGQRPLFAAWDRKTFRSPADGVFPTHNDPDNQFASTWSLAYSPFTPSYMVQSIASHQNASLVEQSGYSTNGGLTWQPFAYYPKDTNLVKNANTGVTNGAFNTFGCGTMAVSSPGNILWTSSYGKGTYYTLDGGATPWQPITIPGITNYANISNKPYYVYHRSICADPMNAGTFYLYFVGQGTYRSTDGGANWTKQSTNITGIDYSFHMMIKAMPGRVGDLFLTPGPSAITTEPFKRSTNAGATWVDVPGMTGVTGFGFGKPLATGGPPTIFLAGFLNGEYAIWRSSDDAATWVSLGQYPDGVTRGSKAMDGDKDVAGRVYMGVGGGGWVYSTLHESVTNPTITYVADSTDPQIITIQGATVDPADPSVLIVPTGVNVAVDATDPTILTIH